MTDTEKIAGEVATMCHLAKKMTHAAGLKDLTYLLEMAALEASMIQEAEFKHRSKSFDSAA
jgi:hypothetical protein